LSSEQSVIHEKEDNEVMRVKNRCGRELNEINPITTIVVKHAAVFNSLQMSHTPCEFLNWKFTIFSYKARVYKSRA
jgi:hypothetical protein